MKIRKFFKGIIRDKSQFKVDILSKKHISKEVCESIKRIAFEYKHLESKNIEKIIYDQHKIRAQVYIERQNNRIYVVI